MHRNIPHQEWDRLKKRSILSYQATLFVNQLERKEQHLQFLQDIRSQVQEIMQEAAADVDRIYALAHKQVHQENETQKSSSIS